MKQAPILTVVIAGVVGAASAVGTSMLLAPAAGSGRAQVAAANPSVKKDYDEEITKLVQQNEELQMRIANLEARPAAVPMRAPVMAEASEADERSSLAAMDDGEVPEAFVASVGDALDQIRDQEREEREQEILTAQAERLEERLVELREKLGLSQYQVDEMRTALTLQNEKRAAMFAGGPDNTNWGTMREDMMAMREETDAALKTILTPEQFEGYNESERENRFGGFGRGRGGDGGGRGGRGGGGNTGGNTGGGGRRGG